MRLSILLLSSSVVASPAISQTSGPGANLAITAEAAGAQPAPPVTGESAPTAVPQKTPDTGSESIVVFGKRATRQTQEISTRDIALLPPGTSTMKAIEKLPSVNFQSADAFGNYEWSERLTIRGFNQNQLGFSLDGIPLGDQTYGNVNGLHTSRAISPENVALTRVTQGAGALGTQATNNLGGTVELFSREPAATFGIGDDAGYGSWHTFREFTRIDSGGDQVRGYVSFGHLGLDKWKGHGVQRQTMVNAKGVANLGAAKLTATYDFSDRKEQDYQDLSLDMIQRLGYNNDNIANNFPLAVQIAWVGANRGDTGAPVTNPAAGTVYPAPYTTVDDVYFDASGLRRDHLASVNAAVPLGGQAHFSLTGYYHHNRGQGTWFTPYVPSPSGVPISVRTTEYAISRGGAFGSFDTIIGANHVTVGGGYETNHFDLARRFYGLDSVATPTRSALDYLQNPFFTQWQFAFKTDTLQYHASDVIALGDLTLSFGSKGFDVTNHANPIVSGGRAGGRIDARDWFQPEAGINYKLGGHAEVFADFAQVTRAFVSATTTGPFSTTQAGFDAIKGTLKPEQSDTYEAGARFRSGGFSGTAGAYYVDFRNRLLAITTGAGIVGNPSVLQNVGKVRSFGLEFAGNYEIGNGFRAFGSYSYNSSTYRDNVLNALGAVIAPIAGKTTVDAPHHLASGELSYDGRLLIGRVAVNYMSKRFFTYTNDQSLPGRAIVDAMIGAHLGMLPMHNAEIQLNAVNLFNKRYVATIGSNGFGNSGDNQTLLAGAPREFLATLKFGL
jgi:iron complex outermembrane receptor protein